MPPEPSRASTNRTKPAPAVGVFEPTGRRKCRPSGTGLTVVLTEPVRPAATVSVTVTVCEPSVRSVTPVNVRLPWKLALNVKSAGSEADGSLLVTWTVPAYQVDTLPYAS